MPESIPVKVTLILIALFMFGVAFLLVQKHKKTNAEWTLLAAGGVGFIGVVMAIVGLGYLSLLLFLAVLNSWAFYQHRVTRAAWAKGVMTVCAIILLCLSTGSIMYTSFGCKEKNISQQLQAREAHYQAALTAELARYISENAGVTSIVLVQDIDGAASVKSAKNLRDALSGKVEVDGVEYLIETPVGTTTDTSDMGMMMEPGMYANFTNEKLEDLVQSYDTTGLMLMFCGLPYDFANSKFAPIDPLKRLKAGEKPREPKKMPPVILVMNVAGFRSEYLRDGLVKAVILINPAANYDPEMTAPESLSEAFKERYVIVTAENYDAQSDDIKAMIP